MEFEFVGEHCWYAVSSCIGMIRSIIKLAGGLVGASLLGAISLYATPVTVKEVGVGANKVVNISSSSLGTVNAYAGVIKLMVDGVPTDGFCIDPWHFSTSGVNMSYQTRALEAAPKPPGPMGTATALKIEQLWEKYYTPSITNSTAAALQIAIWKLVDTAIANAFFSINGQDYGASTMVSWVNSNPNAPAADLIGLSGPGQDYVVKRVPDSGTSVALLGLSFLGLVALRKRFRR